MRNQELYEKYAALIVKRGANVQVGQPVLLRIDVRAAEFAALIVKKCYEAGASHVDVDWKNEQISLMNYMYRTKESLSEVPDWLVQQKQSFANQKYCQINIISDTPGLMKNMDAEKVQAYANALSSKTRDYTKYFMNNDGQWTIAGYPTVEWAKAVFPDDDEDTAFEKLEQAILYTSRVSEDTDPLQNWKIHDEELIEHAKKLNAYHFKALHFVSELGTDLTVELVRDHVWVGGGDATPEGVYFDPNIPTEEVFCMPYKYGVNGVVYASKPLSYNGTVIENFNLTFKDGKVVEHHAEKEEEALTRLLDFDEGSRYLGEVALVPYDSPISQLGFLFFNTLYDENAACHLALGQAYPENMKNGVNMSEEELIANGMNDSLQHEDFMFGTEHMHVEGIREDGTTITIFDEGNFVL